MLAVTEKRCELYLLALRPNLELVLRWSRLIIRVWGCLWII